MYIIELQTIKTHSSHDLEQASPGDYLLYQ